MSRRKYIYTPRPQESCKNPPEIREWQARKMREYRLKKKKKKA